MKTKQRPEKIGLQERFFTLRLDAATEQSNLIDLDARTMRVSFSSEEPVDNWMGRQPADQGASYDQEQRAPAG